MSKRNVSSDIEASVFQHFCLFACLTLVAAATALLASFFWQRRSQECVLWKLVRRSVAAAVIKLRAGVNSGAVHEARREEEAELELTFFCA